MSGKGMPRELGEVKSGRSWDSGTVGLTSALGEFELGMP